jgi:hypothetical protein
LVRHQRNAVNLIQIAPGAGKGTRKLHPGGVLLAERAVVGEMN